MTDEGDDNRVVLGRNEPLTMVGFQWTGAEPEGLSDTKMAEYLGAMWEGDELVTYNLREFRHNYAHIGDQYLYDPD